MTLGQLSPWSEFTPVPSHGSTFVYMILLQMSPRREFTPVIVLGQKFHSGMKSRRTFRCEIGLLVDWNG